MRAALTDSENKIINIIEIADLTNFENAKFLSDKSKLKIGESYDVDLAVMGEGAQSLIHILIDKVAHILSDFNDSDNEYTVNENTDVVATGSLAIADQKFRVPFKRIDTGRIQLMVAEVVDGKFTLNMNFKSSGIWVVNNELINMELAEPMFNIDEHRFAVI